MWLYVSEHEKFNDFGNEDALVWHETNVPYAVWGPAGTRTHSLKYFPSEVLQNFLTNIMDTLVFQSLFSYGDLVTELLNLFNFQAVKHNGSVYAHVFFARSGYPADPNDPEYQQLSAFGKTHRKIMTDVYGRIEPLYYYIAA